MNYGLYLSAAGIMTNSYQLDVISNNLANADTVGFKRTLAAFQERPTAWEERGRPQGATNTNLEPIGGGILASPTLIDVSQGDLEQTGNPFDVSILGKGYFAVDDNGQTRLTRDGRFVLNQQGQLVTADDGIRQVLDMRGKPITLDLAQLTRIAPDGQITQDGHPVARLGVFDTPDSAQLVKLGDGLFQYPDATGQPVAAPQLRNGFVERSNVDPTGAMVQLMQTQRQLEANANMIRIQDQTLGTLVNQVGRIS